MNWLFIIHFQSFLCLNWALPQFFPFSLCGPWRNTYPHQLWKWPPLFLSLHQWGSGFFPYILLSGKAAGFPPVECLSRQLSGFQNECGILHIGIDALLGTVICLLTKPLRAAWSVLRHASETALAFCLNEDLVDSAWVVVHHGDTAVACGEVLLKQNPSQLLQKNI